MNAVRLAEWGGELTVSTVPVPDPRPHEVRVDVQACGVTRTIENVIQGSLSDDPTLLPRIPGHEFAGVVEAVGNDVSTWSVGDRVLAYFYLACDHCDACRRGQTSRCLELDGWVGVHTDGAYAEKAVVPGNNVLPLPDEASFVDGAVAADGLSTPLHVCDRATVTDTDTVVIIGAAGRVGIHLAQVARMRGATVLAADVDDDRLDHVDRVTDEHVHPIEARADDFGDELRRLTPDRAGPTVVVDTVGDTDTLRSAWDSLGMGGRVVSLTTHHDRIFGAPMKDYVRSEASFLGSRYATKDEVVRAARLLADGRAQAVVTGTIGFEEVPDVHRQLRTGKTGGLTVLEP